jgi:hypothetical protein
MLCHERTGQETLSRAIFSISYESTDSACCFFEPFKWFQKGPAGLSGDGFARSGWGATCSGSNFLSPLFNGAPQRRRSPVEGGSIHVVVGKAW